jgi:mevalonate kinase
MSVGRAPGKVILLGEHAVVYGEPALAAAIDRYVTVTVEPADSSDVPDAFAAIARDAGFAGGFRVEIASEIPIGGGLGSSAAVGVALARAFKPGCSADEAARLAMHLERSVHGKPSGVDPAACAHGGIIFFEQGKVEQVNGSAWLCVVHSGLARATGRNVLGLAERRKTDPVIDTSIRRLGELARQGRALLEMGNLRGLGNTMTTAHGYLRDGLEVSCEELEAAVQKLVAAGALGAKLTGAGGGGVAIGLAHDERHAREMAARTGGFAVKVGR